MLYLGEKQITPAQVALKFKFDLEKIKKHPSFEVSSDRKWIDKANMGIVKTAAGMSIRTNFTVLDPDTGMKELFRYVEKVGQRTISSVATKTFEPREVRFMGMKNAYKNNIDLAVFLFLHMDNSESPLRRGEGIYPKPRWTFIDKSKRAETRIAKVNQVAEAMEGVKAMSPEQLVVFAKGVGFRNISTDDFRTAQADIMEWALKNPQLYLEKSNDMMVTITGKIHHLIDNKVFKVEKIGSVRRWTWAEGRDKGATIVDIVNQTVDERQGLINYIFEYVNDYLPAITNLTNDINARNVAKRSIEQVPVEEVLPTIGEDLPDHLRDFNGEETEVMPTTFQEAVAYLTKLRGKRPSNQEASAWFKQYQETVAI